MDEPTRRTVKEAEDEARAEAAREMVQISQEMVELTLERIADLQELSERLRRLQEPRPGDVGFVVDEA